MRLYFTNPHTPHAVYAEYAHVHLCFPNQNAGGLQGSNLPLSLYNLRLQKLESCMHYKYVQTVFQQCKQFIAHSYLHLWWNFQSINSNPYKVQLRGLLYAMWHFCFLFLPIFPIVDVKCGGFCVAESSVPVRALPPSNIHAMCGAADLVLMVVRRCRCRALPGDLAPSGGADQGLHLGLLLHLGSSGLSPPSGTLGPPCHCTPLPAYQGTHIHSTVERLRFGGRRTMKRWDCSA